MEPSVAPAPRGVRCPKCRQPLLLDTANTEVVAICGNCRSNLQIRSFSTLGQSSQEALGVGTVALEGEAACFFHPEKKAVRSCERCGRFVCTLCDMPLGVRHLCPSCVGSGLESDKVPELVNRRFVWGGFALTLGFLPLLLGIFFWPFFVLTGPTAIFAGIWGWKKPGSVVKGQRRVASIFGIIGGLIQTLIFCGVVFAVWKGANHA